MITWLHISKTLTKPSIEKLCCQFEKKVSFMYICVCCVVCGCLYVQIHYDLYVAYFLTHFILYVYLYVNVYICMCIYIYIYIDVCVGLYVCICILFIFYFFIFIFIFTLSYSICF